jgi:hypothetical protein
MTEVAVGLPSCRRRWRHLSAYVCSRRLPRPCGPRKDEEGFTRLHRRLPRPCGPRRDEEGRRLPRVSLFRHCAQRTGVDAAEAWLRSSRGNLPGPGFGGDQGEDRHDTDVSRDDGVGGRVFASCLPLRAASRHFCPSLRTLCHLAGAIGWLKSLACPSCRVLCPKDRCCQMAHEVNRDISQPRSAAEDCHGPAGLAKTGWQSASGRQLARRTLVTAGADPPPPSRPCSVGAEGCWYQGFNSSCVKGLVDTVALSIRGIAERRVF